MYTSYSEQMFKMELMSLRVSLMFYRYEDEINKRAGAENEFVLLKKVQIYQYTYQYNQKIIELILEHMMTSSDTSLFLSRTLMLPT